MTLDGFPPTAEEAVACEREGITLCALRSLRAERARGGSGVGSGADRVTGGRVRTHCPERAGVTEASEQEAIRQELLERGWKVRRVGQRDARGTQDPGVSDLIATRPMGGWPWGVLFVECKRPHGGEESEAQHEFGIDVMAANGLYVCGSLPRVRAFLDALEQGGLIGIPPLEGGTR